MRFFALGVILLAWVEPADAQDVKIAVISDLNGGYGSTEYSPDVEKAVSKVVDLAPDLVISTGDMVAGQRRPHLSSGQVDAMWAAFHRHVSDRFVEAGIPFLVTPGNHDASGYSGFAAERRAYKATWSPRKPALDFIDDAGYPFQYAASFDGVLLVSLDVTTTGPLAVAQKDWLRGVLGMEKDRHRATVLFSHLPIWPVARGRETEITADPDLVQILREFGVDVYLSGHHHAYYPGVSGDILFLAQACLGGGPRPLIGSENSAAKAVTILTIEASGAVEEYALAAPSFDAPIVLDTLPRSIGTGKAKLVRRDLVEH